MDHVVFETAVGERVWNVGAVAVGLMYFGREGLLTPERERGWVGIEVVTRDEDGPVVFLFSAKRLNCVGAKKLRTSAKDLSAQVWSGKKGRKEFLGTDLRL
ncbi:hypothetical protein TNCV_1452251 [Trichonephila clavipes]|nr:hypothetical protein TNCV_1452251 [Trichonephila clavipes]